MKILEWIKGVKVGTNGYELEEFEKPDGGDVEEKVKRKVLYTGPLSAVGSPTALVGGEKFSNWDLIEVDFVLHSDASTAGYSPSITDEVTLGAIPTLRSYADSGYLQFRKLADTSFELDVKTVVAGNISRIIGIKL